MNSSTICISVGTLFYFDYQRTSLHGREEMMKINWIVKTKYKIIAKFDRKLLYFDSISLETFNINL